MGRGVKILLENPVMIALPPKQGLKPSMALGNPLVGAGYDSTSTKTRIETVPQHLQKLKTQGLVMIALPPKQGLKPIGSRANSVTTERSSGKSCFALLQYVSAD